MRSIQKIIVEKETGKKYLVKDLNDDFHTSAGVISKKDLQSNKTLIKSIKKDLSSLSKRIIVETTIDSNMTNLDEGACSLTIRFFTSPAFGLFRKRHLTIIIKINYKTSISYDTFANLEGVKPEYKHATISLMLHNWAYNGNKEKLVKNLDSLKKCVQKNFSLGKAEIISDTN